MITYSNTILQAVSNSARLNYVLVLVGSHDLILMFRYETYFLDKIITFHIIQRFVYCKFIKYTHSGAMLLCYLLMIINAKKHTLMLSLSDCVDVFALTKSDASIKVYGFT